MVHFDFKHCVNLLYSWYVCVFTSRFTFVDVACRYRYLLDLNVWFIFILQPISCHSLSMALWSSQPRDVLKQWHWPLCEPLSPHIPSQWGFSGLIKIVTQTSGCCGNGLQSTFNLLASMSTWTRLLFISWDETDNRLMWKMGGGKHSVTQYVCSHCSYYWILNGQLSLCYLVAH